MKRYYEIALLQHVQGSVEDDYESVYFESAGGYRSCAKKAKELSKHIGKTHVPGIPFQFKQRISAPDFPQQPLDEGLAAVMIVCYTETAYTAYEPLYYEYYRDGKVDYKIEF